MEKDLINNKNWTSCDNGKAKVYRLVVHKSDSITRKSIRQFQSGDVKAFQRQVEIDKSSDANYNYGHTWAIKANPDPFTEYSVSSVDTSTTYSNFCEIPNEVDTAKKLILNVDNTSSDRFKIISDAPDPTENSLPIKSDYAYKIEYDESSDEYKVIQNYRIDFLYTDDENRFRAEYVQMNSKFMIAKLEQTASSATSLSYFRVFLRGIGKNSFLYSKRLSDVIDDYDQLVNFVPADDTLQTDQWYEDFKFDVQVNSYGSKMLLKVYRERMTDNENMDVLDYSRHYLMEWNDCKNKFEVLDFLDTSKASRIQKDVPNFDDTNYHEQERHYNAKAKHIHEEIHDIEFEYILTPNDDILIYSKYKTEYKSRIETNYQSSQTCDKKWYINHTLKDNNFHKYFFNTDTNKLEKTSEKTDLLPFPDMTETGELGGSTPSWNGWPQDFFVSEFNYFGKSNPFYFFKNVKSSISNMTMIHHDKEHLIVGLDVMKPWKRTTHRLTSSGCGSSTMTSEIDLIDRYIIKYKLNESGVFQIESKSNAEDYSVLPENSYVSKREKHIIDARYVNKNILLIKNYNMQIPHYNFNKYGLYKKSISYLDIEDWFQAQSYNLQYGGNISNAPTGVGNGTQDDADAFYGFRLIDMASEIMTFRELTGLTELVKELVKEKECLVDFKCTNDDIFLIIAKFILEDGEIYITDGRLEILKTTDFNSFNTKQTINFFDLSPTEKNTKYKLYGHGEFDWNDELFVIDNFTLNDYLNIKQGLLLS